MTEPHRCFTGRICDGRGWYWYDPGPEWSEEECKRTCYDCPKRAKAIAAVKPEETK